MTEHYPISARPAPRIIGFFCLSSLAVALLSACASSPERSSSTASHSQSAPVARSVNRNNQASPLAQDVLIRAIGLIGTPYRYGGNTPDSGFDCSGLVRYVYAQGGSVNLPRTTREQWSARGKSIDFEHMAPGDLVFFAQSKTVDHVGIYVGDGRFVHAPSSGGTVRIDSIERGYWPRHFKGAKRVIE